jgi:hypothetical protein
MSEVFDDIIDRETDVARIAAVVASDFRFAYFGTAAFAVRLLRLDQRRRRKRSPRSGSTSARTHSTWLGWTSGAQSLCSGRYPVPPIPANGFDDQ